MQQDQEAFLNQPRIDPAKLLWSRTARCLLMAAGVVIPAVCLLVGFPERPYWQSGNLGDYAQLLLCRPGCVPLYPFLLYSMACLTLLVRDPAKWSKMFLVRLGIYAGALLALEHWVLFAFAFDDEAIIILITTAGGALLFGTVLTLVLLAIVAVARHFRRGMPFLAVGVTAFLVLESLHWLVYRESLCGYVVGGCLLGCLFFSTPLAVAVYSIMSFDLLRPRGTQRFRFSLAQLFVVCTWLAAHLGRGAPRSTAC